MGGQSDDSLARPPPQGSAQRDAEPALGLATTGSSKQARKQLAGRSCGARKRACAVEGTKASKKALSLQRLESQFQVVWRDFAEAYETTQRLDSELGDLRAQVASTVKAVRSIRKARAQVAAELQLLRSHTAGQAVAADKPSAQLMQPSSGPQQCEACGQDIPPAPRLCQACGQDYPLPPCLQPPLPHAAEPGTASGQDMTLEDWIVAAVPLAEQPSPAALPRFDVAPCSGMPGLQATPPVAFADLGDVCLLEDYTGPSLTGAVWPASLEPFLPR